MKIAQQIATHLRQVYFGGNWTAANFKEKLADVTWQQATTEVGFPHNISDLVYHSNYFITATIKVLKGGPLDAKDKFSFDCPRIESDEDWDRFLEQVWSEVEELACLIESLPEEQLAVYFGDDFYGSHYRCLQGLVEHCHYHLGQIALIKSLLLKSN